MNLILTLLLAAVLAGALASFLVMGYLQVRRRTHLARHAHADGMRFAAEDPFGVVTRYGDFALFAAGHSGRAHNVTHGRVGGLATRAFDFRYEVGHGIRRVIRRYAVVAVEVPRRLPAVLMWHESDWDQAPLAAVRADGVQGEWRFRGDAAWVETLAGATAEAAPEVTGLQTRGDMLLCWAPLGRRRQRDYSVPPDRIIEVLKIALPEPGGAG